MRARYESETDPLRRLGWAFDWLRFELGHLAHSQVPDGRHQADTLTRELAAYVAASAEQVSARSNQKDGDGK
jgi:hypothetical protein